MTAHALFRFTGPDQSQLACIDKGDGWSVQHHDEFVAANGGGDNAAWLWNKLPYAPKPMEDYPELEAALAKIREYLAEQRPVRDKIASLKSQGILADEGELLGKIAEIHDRLVSMYLAKAGKLFATIHRAAEPVAVAVTAPADGAVEKPDPKTECVEMVTVIVDRMLPDELTDRLSPDDAQNLTREMIRFAFEPHGRLRERARRDPHRLVELVGLATLPAVAKGRRHNVARILVEMLEHANLVGFDAELGDGQNWPRLRARVRRGGMLVS
jgi:hypothetical protein